MRKFKTIAQAEAAIEKAGLDALKVQVDACVYIASEVAKFVADGGKKAEFAKLHNYKSAGTLSKRIKVGENAGDLDVYLRECAHKELDGSLMGFYSWLTTGNARTNDNGGSEYDKLVKRIDKLSKAELRRLARLIEKRLKG